MNLYQTAKRLAPLPLIALTVACSQQKHPSAQYAQLPKPASYTDDLDNFSTNTSTYHSEFPSRTSIGYTEDRSTNVLHSDMFKREGVVWHIFPNTNMLSTNEFASILLKDPFSFNIRDGNISLDDSNIVYFAERVPKVSSVTYANSGPAGLKVSRTLETRTDQTGANGVGGRITLSHEPALQIYTIDEKKCILPVNSLSERYTNFPPSCTGFLVQNMEEQGYAVGPDGESMRLRIRGSVYSFKEASFGEWRSRRNAPAPVVSPQPTKAPSAPSVLGMPEKIE